MPKVVCPLCLAADPRFLHRSDDRHGTREFHCCAVCDLAFVPPLFHLPEAVERDRYLMHDNDPEDAGYRAFLGRLWDVLSPRLEAGDCGLDYGCGPGPALAEMIREAGFEIALYDLYFFPDQTPLERTYDFITCTETVEHLRNPLQVFTLLDGLLRPHGRLGVLTGILDDRSTFGDWYYQRDPTHVAFYSRRTLRWVGDRMNWATEFPSENVTIFTKCP